MPSPEYCFLDIQWWPFCMTKGEWSGWVQAIFSVIAIFIAVAVPAAMKRRENEERHEVACARAQIAAVGILPLLPPIQGAIGALLTYLEGIKGGRAVPPSSLLEVYKEMIYPSEHELESIGSFEPECAIDLVQGQRLFTDVRTTLSLIVRTLASDHAAGQMLSKLELPLRHSEAAFEKATLRLEKILQFESSE